MNHRFKICLALIRGESIFFLFSVELGLIGIFYLQENVVSGVEVGVGRVGATVVTIWETGDDGDVDTIVAPDRLR